MTGLSLTPIERYFFHDHRGSHPAWIRFELTFEGSLKQESFTRAWQQIQQRHPLVGATVVKRRWGSPVWKLNTAQPELVWGEAEKADDNKNSDTLHDLSTRSGLQGRVNITGAETHLTLWAHHAVADGCGLLLIAEDLLALYTLNCGVKISLPAPAPLRSQKTGTVGLTFQWKHSPWLVIGVVWGMILGRQRVLELRGTSGGDHRRSGLLPAFNLAEETAQLRGKARLAGATLNEMHIRDVQSALGAWLQRHQRVDAEEWMRLLVPVNVGGVRSETRVSANSFGVALIERRVRSLGRRPRLLQRAHEDMEFIRRRGLMSAFGAALWLRGWLFGAIARHCRREGARSTMIFSNLGKVFQHSPLLKSDGSLAVPGATLTRFACWGPCRPATNIFLLAAEYRGNMTICITFDPAVMSTLQAQDFAEEFKRQVSAT